MADASGRAAVSSGDAVPEVPGYRIERQLGRGSMGVVYLAEDLQLRRKVALKILAPALADDELFHKRFDRESQSAANLDHPSIVPVYAAGEAAGSLYIAMRYVSGGDLRTLLETSGRLGLEQVASIVEAVAGALDAAHAQGMIHRDVKPANILIDDYNGQKHYYLSDFGIAKIMSSGGSLTSTGQIVGTIDYVAPEQIQGKPVDSRSDLYALGCVLYQCLTGMVPFPRNETAALMWAHVHDDASPVTARRPDLPPQIDGIVAKAMAKQPEDRYHTCRELALALRFLAADPAASDGSVSVAPARPVESPPPQPVVSGMTSTYTPPTPAPVPEASASSASRGWRWWWFAAGVLVLALIGGSTVGAMKYLGSRFPNAAEQQLLNAVPLALTSKNSCARNSVAEQDSTVEASVVCTPSDSDANVSKVVYTKFRSTRAMNSRYQAAVATAGVGVGSGNCLSGDRTEGTYTGVADQASGRALCYEDRGSSFVAWTDDQAHTLTQATRVDPDYLKLRDWWAGVVGLPTKAQTEAQAEANKQVEEAQKQAAEAKKQAEDAQKQIEENQKQQAADAKKRQEEADRKQQAEENQRQIDAANDAKKQAEDAQQRLQEARQQPQNDQGNSSRESGGQSEDANQSQDNRDRSQGDRNQDNDRNQNNGNQGQGNGGVNAGGQDIQQLIDDAMKKANQQRGSSQDIRQQIEEQVRKSIQQQGNTRRQGSQQQIDDAIKKALEAQQNQR